MDQVGVNFDLFSSAKTWATPDETETNAIRCQGSGPGGDKRFGTLHICLGADLSLPQPKLLIVLKLKAGIIQAPEQAAYDALDNVVVAFQKCAVVEAKTLEFFFEEVWKPYKETIKEPVLLTFDSLVCQPRLSFRKKAWIDRDAGSPWPDGQFHTCLASSRQRRW